MIKNTVGIEAEFILLKDGEVVYPSDYGFDTDEFIILGEFRAECGENVPDTIANFYKAWYSVVEKANKHGLIVCLDGYKIISADKYTEIMRRMGNKEINNSLNLYGVDILKLSDAVMKGNVVEGHRISTGLHIHFGSSDTKTCEVIHTDYIYTPFSYEYSLGKGGNAIPIVIDGYHRSLDKVTNKQTDTITVSRITYPVIKYIIEWFDTNVYPNYYLKVPLKYRNAGFYELKPHGFEYRSLPFYTKTLGDMYDIVSKAFDRLREL